MSIIVIVTTHRPHPRKDGAFVAFPFLCDYADIQAMEDILGRGAAVTGYQISYDKAHGRCVVDRKIPYSFTASERRSLATPNKEFIERDGRPVTSAAAA